MRNVNLPWGLELCRKAFHKKRHRKRVVAAYIEGNTIIIDSNSRKTHPDANRFGHRLNHTHAELAVLRHVNDASRGTLYVYRETQDGELAMARPCEFCMKLLREKSIKKIVYTTCESYLKEKLV